MRGPRLATLFTRRMAARILVIVSLSLISLIVTAPASHADFDLCKDPPLATMPDSSPAGWLAGKPDWSTVPDVAPDPFAADAKVGIGDVYGFNFDWKVYDLGCGNDTLRDPQAIGVTSAANIAIQWPSAWAALEARMHDLVYASPMQWIQDMIAKVNSAVADKLWNVWFPITVIAAGGWIVLRSRRANYAESSRAIGVIIIVAAAAIFFLNYPTRASDAMDKIANTASTVASAPFSNAAGTDAIARNVMYPQWLQGEFGSATSPTAVKYGPDLYWATHYTWSEYKQVRADQKNLKVIDDRKGQLFEKTAKEIETNDPVAYGHLTGKDPEARLQAAVMAYPFVIASTIFMMISLLMLAVAKVMLQAFVIAVPILSIPAAHPKGWGLLMSAWDLFTAAIFAAVKFAFLGGLFSLFLAAVLNSGQDPVEQLFWLVLITIVAFAISRPFRSLKSMTPGVDPNRSYAREALNLVASFGGARLGAASAQGEDTTEKPRTAEVGDPVGAESTRRSEDESLVSLPPPPRRSMDAIGGAAVGSSAAQAPGLTEPSYSVQQVFNPDEDDEPLPPLPAAVPVPRQRLALEASPVELDDRDQWQPARVHEADRIHETARGRSILDPAAPTVVTAPAAYGDADANGSGPGAPFFERPSEPVPVSAPLGSTGDGVNGGLGTSQPYQGGSLLSAGRDGSIAGTVLGDEEVPLYRSGDDTASPMSEIHPAEVQIDNEGNETHLIYQAGVGRA